mmetsp:Transcript_13024/g.34754  ORF Transcript_13024/g.34754 Transcript_13024/m.34754 type:complete len:266 (-) Transcript_13024:997-1794(-)
MQTTASSPRPRGRAWWRTSTGSPTSPSRCACTGLAGAASCSSPVGPTTHSHSRRAGACGRGAAPSLAAWDPRTCPTCPVTRMVTRISRHPSTWTASRRSGLPTLRVATSTTSPCRARGTCTHGVGPTTACWASQTRTGTRSSTRCLWTRAVASPTSPGRRCWTASRVRRWCRCPAGARTIWRSRPREACGSGAAPSTGAWACRSSSSPACPRIRMGTHTSRALSSWTPSRARGSCRWPAGNGTASASPTMAPSTRSGLRCAGAWG